jgi:hypothetical protein
VGGQSYLVVSFTFIVVTSCWSSSGDVELSMLLLPPARTHLKRRKQKKKFAPVTRMVIVREGGYIWYQSGFDPRLGTHYEFR